MAIDYHTFTTERDALIKKAEWERLGYSVSTPWRIPDGWSLAVAGRRAKA